MRQLSHSTGARLVTQARSPCCSLSLLLAWKVTTRRAPIGIASPCAGLRPGRGAWYESGNCQNPTASHRHLHQALRNQVKGVHHVLDSRLFNLMWSNSRSASCALVRAGVSGFPPQIRSRHCSVPVLHAQSCAHLLGQSGQYGLHGGIDSVSVRLASPPSVRRTARLFTRSQTRRAFCDRPVLDRLGPIDIKSTASRSRGPARRHERTP